MAADAPAALKRSKDRKVTNAVTPSGAPAIANSIGLPSGKQFSCTDQTDYCAVICYAGKLEKVYKGVSAVLLHNWNVLSNADYATMVQLLTDMVAEFRRDSVKRGAELLFRIHWDGDFFNGTYVAAWSKVIRQNSDIQFWAYTRVPSAATFLHAQRLPNLSLYFSADRDNIAIARKLDGAGVNIAYVGDTFADGKAEFRRAARCPENAARKLPDGTSNFPLINSDGSACARCGICIKGTKSVLFSATKK